MKAIDEQIIESYRRTRSPLHTGKELGIHRNSVSMRIWRLIAKGVDLPLPLKVFERDPDYAREMGKKGKKSRYERSRTIQRKSGV